MLTKDRTLAEGLSAYMAHIGLLTSVYSLVLEEMTAPAKALSTLDAYIGSLSTRSHLGSSNWYTRVQNVGILGAIGLWTPTEVRLCFVMVLIDPPQRCFRQRR